VFSKTSEFLHNVREEMKKVTWPERKDVHASAVVVVAIVLVSAVYLWVVDTCLASLVRMLLR